jgi:hypothetical protein
MGNLVEGQKICCTCYKDYFSEVDGKEHRILLDEDKNEVDLIKQRNTSWPSPIFGQEISYIAKIGYSDSDLYMEEIREEYWFVGEFSRLQKLELEYIEDYTNIKGDTHRVLIDSKGRKYDTLVFDRDTKNPEFGQTITYVVKKITDKGYPIIDEFVAKNLNSSGNFKEGQIVLLTLEKEWEKKEWDGYVSGYRKLIDDNNLIHIVKRAPFQRGHKYQPRTPGEKIKYKIVSFRNDQSPIFWEDNISNDYFIDLNELSEVTQKIYRANISTYFEKAEEQRIKNNALWVWSLLNSLHKLKKQNLDLLNISVCKDSISAILDLISHINSDGFLETFQKKDREERKKSLIQQKLEVQLLDKALEISLLDNYEVVFETLIDEVGGKDKNQSYELILILVEYFESMFSDSQIENIILKIKETFGFDKLSLIRRFINERKKRYRRKIFEDESLISNTRLNNNTFLRHIIFIEEVEYELLKSTDQKAYAKLAKADLLRYQGYYNEEQDYVLESISLLEEKINITTLIPNKIERERWFRDLNFSLAHNYRFLAKFSENTQGTINFFKKSVEHFSKLGSFVSYIDQGLVKYYEMVLLFENNEDIEVVIKKSKMEYNYYSQPTNATLFRKDSFLMELVDMFDIMRLIGNSGSTSKQKLLEYTEKDTTTKVLSNKLLSSFILSDSLLREFSDVKLIDQLAQVFLDGSLNLKNSSLLSIEDALEVENLDRENRIIQEINAVECHTLEYKASFALDIDAYISKGRCVVFPDGRKNDVAKSIASMLNSNDGGDLYIGILELKDKYKNFDTALRERFGEVVDTEQGMLIGIDTELMEKNKEDGKKRTVDDYMSSIQSYIENKIDKDSSSQCIFEAINVKEKMIIKIHIKSKKFRAAGWWVTQSVKVEGSKSVDIDTLYVRCNNGTKTFSTKEGYKELERRRLELQG